MEDKIRILTILFCYLTSVANAELTSTTTLPLNQDLKDETNEKSTATSSSSGIWTTPADDALGNLHENPTIDGIATMFSAAHGALSLIHQADMPSSKHPSETLQPEERQNCPIWSYLLSLFDPNGFQGGFSNFNPNGNGFQGGFFPNSNPSRNGGFPPNGNPNGFSGGFNPTGFGGGDQGGFPSNPNPNLNGGFQGGAQGGFPPNGFSGGFQPSGFQGGFQPNPNPNGFQGGFNPTAFPGNQR